MEQIKNTNHEDITLILRIIDKLLSIPMGEQIYAPQIGTLFKNLELASNPMFIV